ncbi:hypothetical protein Tco_0345110 [Tanacetum coccineum]
MSDSEDEETENQWRKTQDIDDDPLVSLVRESMKEKDIDFMTLTKISASGKVQEQDISPTTLEAAKTLSQSIEKDISTDLDADIEVNPGSEDFNTGNEDFNTGSLGVSTGSGPNTFSRTHSLALSKKEAGLQKPLRLQALQEEEAARYVHLECFLKKRIGIPSEQKLEANAELTKSLQGEKSEIGIDVIPTTTKTNSIVDWKIIPRSGLKAINQIIRRDGSDKIYMSFVAILKDFSRDDLTELYILVIKKYGVNRPEEIYDRVLWGDLKTMFDPPLSDDAIWNRKYPLLKDACQVMLKMKLLDGTMDEVCYQLLKMIEKQAGIRKCCDEEKTKTKRQKKLRT